MKSSIIHLILMATLFISCKTGEKPEKNRKTVVKSKFSSKKNKNSERNSKNSPFSICAETSTVCSKSNSPWFIFKGSLYNGSRYNILSENTMSYSISAGDLGNLIIPVNKNGVLKFELEKHGVIFEIDSKPMGALVGNIQIIKDYQLIKSFDLSSLNTMQLQEAVELLKSREGLFITVKDDGQLKLVKTLGHRILGIDIVENLEDLSLLTTFSKMEILEVAISKKIKNSVSLKSIKHLGLNIPIGSEIEPSNVLENMGLNYSKISHLSIGGETTKRLISLLLKMKNLKRLKISSIPESLNIQMEKLSTLIQMEELQLRFLHFDFLKVNTILNGMTNLRKIDITVRKGDSFEKIVFPENIEQLILYGGIEKGIFNKISKLKNLKFLNLNSMGKNSDEIDLSNIRFSTIKDLVLTDLKISTLKPFPNLNTLSIFNIGADNIKNLDLQSLKNLTHLEVSVSGPAITKLPQVGKLIMLKYQQFKGESFFTPKDLKSALSKSANYLKLNFPQMGSKYLEKIKESSKLRYLILNCTQGEIPKEIKSFSHLRFFSVIGSKLTKKGMINFLSEDSPKTLSAIYLSKIGSNSIIIEGDYKKIKSIIKKKTESYSSDL
jgi:hypothetical protein